MSISSLKTNMCIQKEEIRAILEQYRDIIINVPDVHCSCDDACFVQVSLSVVRTMPVTCVVFNYI